MVKGSRIEKALSGGLVMKEGITARVGSIISATVNTLIDAVENVAPEAVMEEAMREIDGAIDEVCGPNLG